MRNLLLIVVLLNTAASTAGLRPETLQDFNHYIKTFEQSSEQQLLIRSPYLWLDTLSAAQRTTFDAQLRRGEVVVQSVGNEDGRAIEIPGGLIHHWRGTVFIPGASLRQTLALLQDYDHHDLYYQPDVMQSRLLSRDGDDFRVFLRLRKRKVVTAILDTEYDARYVQLDPTRVYSRSYSTRVAEVENAGGPGERDLPPGEDHGYMWRLNSYWRIQEVADGVYIQCEAISLTRDIPAGLGWLVSPFIRSIPRESLTFTLKSTRDAVLQKSAQQTARSHE